MTTSRISHVSQSPFVVAWQRCVVYDINRCFARCVPASHYSSNDFHNVMSFSLPLINYVSKQWEGLLGKQRNKSALFQTHTHSQTLQRDLFLSIALKMCLQNRQHVELH